MSDENFDMHFELDKLSDYFSDENMDITTIPIGQGQEMPSGAQNWVSQLNALSARC